jgi:multidrug efflux pump subunit AcrA (membrane-fusion protein)
MTAKVTIKSEFIKNTLQVPLTAVFRKDNKSFCLVRKQDETMEIREIQLGSHNMNMAVVTGGLSEGEVVVVNPDHFRSDLELTQSQSLAQK